MDCHATTQGSIPGGDGVKTELHVLRKGQLMVALSLIDLAIDGMLKTTDQPTNQLYGGHIRVTAVLQRRLVAAAIQQKYNNNERKDANNKKENTQWVTL